MTIGFHKTRVVRLLSSFFVGQPRRTIFLTTHSVETVHLKKWSTAGMVTGAVTMVVQAPIYLMMGAMRKALAKSLRCV